jgi:hypothetical protein
MEYFCNKTDAFWALDNESIQAAAIRELEKMDLAHANDVLDITVRRMEKTYPAYFGTYDRFDTIRTYTDQFENLFLVGRNGMHKYNNADHSMLTAMVAVDNIEAGITSKANLWSINTEQEYHEEKSAAEQPQQTSAGPAISRPAPAKPGVPNPFKSWLLENRLNRAFLWIAGISILVQFIIFKILYPYAGFINGDSYVYLQSAYFNMDVNTYPIGYSKFLRLFSIFTNSDTALVAFQYLSIQLSALWFTFTLFFLYSPRKITKWLLFLLIVFNPVFLYISNYVSSDSLFLALSLTWFTLLLWILHRPTTSLIIFQAVILFLAFMVRYNALYYPFIAAIAFLLSKQPLKRKLASIAASLVLIGLFMLGTANHYQRLTGIRQFTPFSGWQIANNAMYAYRYVDSQELKKAPPRLQQLDLMVRKYFDTSRDLRTHPSEMLLASTVYMWDPHSPLQLFMTNRFKKDSTAGPIKRWASMAPLYSEYGSYLIREYPMTFFKYYLWPNAIKYYTPPGEFLDTYNAGADTIQNIAQVWFNYKDKKVRTAFKDLKVKVLDFLPIFSGVMNVIFLFGFFSLMLLQRLNRNSILTGALVLAITLWLVNFGFSVFASPITLRYQLFGVLVFSSFGLLFVDSIYKMAFKKAGS